MEYATKTVLLIMLALVQENYGQPPPPPIISDNTTGPNEGYDPQTTTSTVTESYIADESGGTNEQNSSTQDLSTTMQNNSYVDNNPQNITGTASDVNNATSVGSYVADSSNNQTIEMTTSSVDSMSNTSYISESTVSSSNQSTDSVSSDAYSNVNTTTTSKSDNISSTENLEGGQTLNNLTTSYLNDSSADMNISIPSNDTVVNQTVTDIPTITYQDNTSQVATVNDSAQNETSISDVADESTTPDVPTSENYTAIGSETVGSEDTGITDIPTNISSQNGTIADESPGAYIQTETNTSNPNDTQIVFKQDNGTTTVEISLDQLDNVSPLLGYVVGNETQTEPNMTISVESSTVDGFTTESVMPITRAKVTETRSKYTTPGYETEIPIITAITSSRPVKPVTKAPMISYSSPPKVGLTTEIYIPPVDLLTLVDPPPIFPGGRRPPTYEDDVAKSLGPFVTRTKQAQTKSPTTAEPPPPPIFIPMKETSPIYKLPIPTTTQAPYKKLSEIFRTAGPGPKPRYMTVAELAELALKNLESSQRQMHKGVQVFFQTVRPLPFEQERATTPPPYQVFKEPEVMDNQGSKQAITSEPIVEPPKRFFDESFLLNQIVKKDAGEGKVGENLQPSNVGKSLKQSKPNTLPADQNPFQQQPQLNLPQNRQQQNIAKQLLDREQQQKQQLQKLLKEHQAELQALQRRFKKENQQQRQQQQPIQQQRQQQQPIQQQMLQKPSPKQQNLGQKVEHPPTFTQQQKKKEIIQSQQPPQRALSEQPLQKINRQALEPSQRHKQQSALGNFGQQQRQPLQQPRKELVNLAPEQDKVPPSSKPFFDSNYLLKQIGIHPSNSQTSLLPNKQSSGLPQKTDAQGQSQRNKGQKQVQEMKNEPLPQRSNVLLSALSTHSKANQPRQVQRRRPSKREGTFTPYVKTGDLFEAQALEAWIKTKNLKPGLLHVQNKKQTRLNKGSPNPLNNSKVKNENIKINQIPNNIRMEPWTGRQNVANTFVNSKEKNNNINFDQFPSKVRMQPASNRQTAANEPSFQTNGLNQDNQRPSLTFSRPREPIYGSPDDAFKKRSPLKNTEHQASRNARSKNQINQGHETGKFHDPNFKPKVGLVTSPRGTNDISRLGSNPIERVDRMGMIDIQQEFPLARRQGFETVLSDLSRVNNLNLNQLANQMNFRPNILSDIGPKNIIPARTIAESESHWSSKVGNSIILPSNQVPYFMKTDAGQPTTAAPTQKNMIAEFMYDPIQQVPRRDYPGTPPPLVVIHTAYATTTTPLPTIPPTADPNPPPIFDTKVMQTFMPFPKPDATVKPKYGNTTSPSTDSQYYAQGFDNRCTGCVFVNDRCLLPDEVHCNMFIECVRQGAMVRAFNKECALGSFFDRKSYLCVDPKNADCPQDRCREPGTKWYPVHGHCKHYWSCTSREGGEVYAQSECCPDMGGFDPNVGCVENKSCTDSCGSVVVKNVTETSVCSPMLAVTFENGSVVDTSVTNQHIGNEGVSTTQIGEGIFNGAGRLILWRYANLMFPIVFAIRFRFLSTTDSPRLQTIISNCDPKKRRPSTFEISLDTQYHEVVFKVDTLESQAKMFKQIYQKGGWTTVVLIYDGERIVGSVDNRARNIVAPGGIETRPTPFSVGACADRAGFKGLLDDLTIYEDCIPSDMYGIFMSVLE